mgnify:CR=1 FL=1
MLYWLRHSGLMQEATQFRNFTWYFPVYDNAEGLDLVTLSHCSIANSLMCRLFMLKGIIPYSGSWQSDGMCMTNGCMYTKEEFEEILAFHVSELDPTEPLPWIAGILPKMYR